MTSSSRASIADWLTQLPSAIDQQSAPSSPSSSPSTSPSSVYVQSKASRKRKREADHKYPGPGSKTRVADQVHRRALAEIRGEMSSNRQPKPSGTPSKQPLQTPNENDFRTPSHSSSESSKPRAPEPNGIDFRTPSHSSSKSSKSKIPEPKLPKNVHNTRKSLARHGMRLNDGDAFDNRCPQFKRMVEDIIQKGRETDMQERSQQAAIKTLHMNETQNEKTLFGKLRPLVIPKERTIKTTKHDLAGELVSMLREYDDDGLEMIEDCQFVKSLVPGKDFTSEEKAMGITDPKPDVTFGLREPEFPDPSLPLPNGIQALLGVAPGMQHAFFVIEHKSIEESIGLAEVQATRDGAVLVKARMLLHEHIQPAGYVRPTGADDSSLVFSCAWIPDYAKIYVHWFEKLASGIELYHMNVLSEYIMRRPEEMRLFRRHVQNIMDWGLLKRKIANDGIYDGLVKMYGPGGSIYASVNNAANETDV